MKLVTLVDHRRRKNVLHFGPRERYQTTARSLPGCPSKVCTAAVVVPAAQYHKIDRPTNHPQ